MAGLRQQQFKIIKGLNQDIDIQSNNPEQAFRLFNIKNQTLEAASAGNLTNEKGNTEVRLVNDMGSSFTISGRVIGIIQCTPTMSVLFTYVDSSTNILYRLIYDKTADVIKVRIVAMGDFGIPIVNSRTGKAVDIAGLFVYEHSELQKIYWVDGVNQMRYLNIADSYLDSLYEGAGGEVSHPAYVTEVNKLNSSPSFSLNHHIEVERITGGGIFSPGVIQWAFTYFNRYGAETNIVDMTPLYYIGEESRGVQAGETVGCSYKVKIINPDTSFDYIRLYSIQRNSLNGTPVVKIVKDIKLK